MQDIKAIRKAVVANHGGMDSASNDQIMIIWISLDEQTRAEYIRRVKDVTNSTKRNVPSSPIVT